MSNVNKAYVVFGNGSSTFTEPQGATGDTVTAFYTVLTSGNVKAHGGMTETAVNYGDSNQAIREAVVNAVRTLEDDTTLDVNFITG